MGIDFNTRISEGFDETIQLLIGRFHPGQKLYWSFDSDHFDMSLVFLGQGDPDIARTNGDGRRFDVPLKCGS